MTVVSKYLDEALVKYEKLGLSKHALSKGIVSIAVGAYVAHISYPYLSKLIKAANLSPALSDTATTSDDDTSDSDFDTESDYESASESNIITSNGGIDHQTNRNNNSYGATQLDGDDSLDNDETARGVETDSTQSAGRLKVPAGKRKRKHSKVIKQQIKQAEKFLAATQERKKSEQVGNLSFSQLEERRIGLNLEFLLKLKRLLYIMIPRLWCREIGILGVHTVCLISRTFLSIYVASVEGSIVKFIVRRDLRQFIVGLMKWFSIAIPATFINSMIRYLENKLALSFRTRLVNHSYKLYFKNQTYYRVANLDGRIDNADHRLTEDIAVFTSSIAHLYSHLTKPCFDLMLIGLALMRSSRKMRANIVTGPALAFVVISATALILRQLSPKFGQLVAEEATRYGYLRHVHSRVITNAEEIAFYGGHRVELMQLREAFRRLANQMNIIYSQRLWFVMLEQFFMKYVWSGTGMIMISLPVLMGTASNEPKSQTSIAMPDDGISERTQYLTTARNLLISGADAIERLMSSYKEVVALAGYTYRVAGMLEVFDDTARGRYNKVMMAEGRNNAGILEFRNGHPIAKGRVIVSTDPNDRSISLHNVPVVTPNCDIVVSSLTLRIEPGMHLLITGPNGCGKSSLFRIVNGLWPIYGGELHIPKPIVGKPSMFYIPQRPYLTIGNLRDQIIYPDTVDDMLSKKYDEDMLHDIMKTVSLEHIVARDSFDVVRDWKDILSGGEKQRMAIARLFYHKPQYALLDECTSAVSIDVESSIYEAAKAAGITLLTITHRPTLWKFHTHILQFDGQGGWDFKPLSENDTQQVPQKKQ